MSDIQNRAHRPASLIVICGHDTTPTKFLAKAIKYSSDEEIEICDGSVLNLHAHSGITRVTHHAGDLFALKKLFMRHEWNAEEIRIIGMTRDPRDLLLARSEEVGGGFVQNADHNLHISDKGIPTLSEPGILYTQAVLDNVARRYKEQTFVLDHADLERRPELVRLALMSFTGLDIKRPFAGFLEKDAEWRMRPSGFENRDLDAQERDRLVRQFRLAPALFDILDRWNGGFMDRRWLDELARVSKNGLDDKPGTIVGFYTEGTRYETEAARLKNSVLKLDLPYRLEKVEPQEDWLAAVRCKPGILLELRKTLRGPLLYVDVDAVIHRDPWPYMRGYAGDVAVAGHRNQAIISGTILLNDTPGAIRFLEAWIDAQDRNPKSWDQHSLEDVVVTHRRDSSRFRIQYLPPEMCRVFDRKYNPPIEAVIEHLQASREAFADSADAKRLENLESRRRRLAELDGAFADQPAVARRERTAGLIGARSSDILRWSAPVNLKAGWAARAKVVAGLINNGARVLDLGCGAMDLERELPPGSIYLPADLVQRDARTILCDINSDALPFVAADVVTMLGVLEYCHDPARLFLALGQGWSRLLVTYNPSDLDAGRDRLVHGWFSNLTSADLVGYAAAAGFSLEAIIPIGERERVYSFAKSSGHLDLPN